MNYQRFVWSLHVCIHSWFSPRIQWQVKVDWRSGVLVCVPGWTDSLSKVYSCQWPVTILIHPETGRTSQKNFNIRHRTMHRWHLKGVWIWECINIYKNFYKWVGCDGKSVRWLCVRACVCSCSCNILSTKLHFLLVRTFLGCEDILIDPHNVNGQFHG